MSAPVLEERDDLAAPPHTPFLSHSRLSRYLHCPEQYRLYYLENLRLRVPAANLVFGQVIHQALAALFGRRDDPVEVFGRAWTELRQTDLDYGARDSWQGLHDAGRYLLERFMTEQAPRISRPEAVEKKFELQISDLDLPFVGVIDLVARLDEDRSVIDFKTSGSAYQPHEVVLSDQLTAYRLAEPAVAQGALCVFVKSKVPRIEWHKTQRTAAQLTEYVAKAQLIARQITAGHFYKRPGKWCAWCDYRPVCVGDEQAARETLIQIR
jgi:CRISPR/Cas system-associated exonuclease Cas4 (RecB family)